MLERFVAAIALSFTASSVHACSVFEGRYVASDGSWIVAFFDPDFEFGMIRYPNATVYWPSGRLSLVADNGDSFEKPDIPDTKRPPTKLKIDAKDYTFTCE